MTDDDGKRCYALGISAMREDRVRRGIYAPVFEHERRWAAEGPRVTETGDTAWGRLDTVRSASLTRPTN